MATIRAVVHQGMINVPAPEGCADGSEVLVQLVPAAAAQLTEDEWDDSADGISEWIEWAESLEPLVFTDDESKRMNDEQAARKERDWKRLTERGDQLAEHWK